MPRSSGSGSAVRRSPFVPRVSLVSPTSVKTQRDRLRDEAISLALDQAIAGDRAPLYDRLRRVSGLPGPRLFPGLVRAFGQEAASRGGAVDALLAAMLAIHEDVAPYGHVDEILPILGAAGTGARAAADPKVRAKLLEVLEEAACDVRFRVRETVGLSLVDVGLAVGPSFSDVLAAWLEHEQPYLTCAASIALSSAELAAVLGGEALASLAGKALDRVAREHRAGRRHHAYRELAKVLVPTLVSLASRHPAVATTLESQAMREDEDVRAILAEVAKGMRSHAGERATAIAEALVRSTKAPRDPRWGRLPGKRGRGKH